MVSGIGKVNDAVVHDRRRLIGAAIVHGPDPIQAQIFDVAGGDRLQRAVAVSLIVAPDHQPIAGIGMAQHLIGDRHVVL